MRQGPLSGDVGAEGVQALDQAKVAVALELQGRGDGQIAAAALAGDDDPPRIDVELTGVGMDPFETGDTVVQPGGKGATSGAEDAVRALRKSTMATATPRAAMIRPQALYMPFKQLIDCMPPPWM